MRWLFVLVLVASCGRIDFDARTDAGGDGADAVDIPCILFCPDPTFGTAGYVVIDDGNTANDSDGSRAIAERADGRLVVVGRTGPAGATDNLIVGLTATGARDPAFGTDGIVRFDLTGAAEELNAVVVLPDDSLYVAGTSDQAGSFAHVLPDGTLDPVFAGIPRFLIGSSNTSFNGMLLYPSDQVALGGQTRGVNDFDLTATRVNPTGVVDTTFGAKVYDLAGDEFGNLVAFGPGGTLYLAGQSYVATGDFDGAIARITANGNLDSSFAGIGSQVTGRAGEDRFFDAQVDSQGRIVAVGYTRALDAFLVARFTSTGALDTSFVGGGLATSGLTGNELAHAVAILPDGRIVVAGKTNSLGQDHLVLLLFDADGGAIGNYSPFVTDPSRFSALHVDSQGRILVVGYVTGSDTDLIVGRLYVR